MPAPILQPPNKTGVKHVLLTPSPANKPRWYRTNCVHCGWKTVIHASELETYAADANCTYQSATEIVGK